VAEAIANGVYVPGLMDRPVRDIGEKPKMWDVWLAEPTGQLAAKEMTDDIDGWNGVMPVAATKVTPQGTQTPRMIFDFNAYQAYPTVPRPAFISRFFRHNTSSTAQTSPSTLEAATTPGSSGVPGTPRSATSNTNDKEKDISQVQVSLLIAMPSASRPSSHLSSSGTSSSAPSLHSAGSSEDDPKGKLKATGPLTTSAWGDLEEGEIPHLELGVLEVGYRGKGDDMKKE